ncbi:MAG: DNA-deoxyinosine glycosylase [Ruminococcaceae bacterium]|nr:DNA-deoxyinosine glycosylase [Oscillospiraceae bacterium]
MVSEWVSHAFEPVYDERSRVLILGTMPSPASRENGFYYSHPRNRFWQVMARIFSQPLPTSPEEKRRFCLEHRVALWDVLSRCRIEGAADSSIREPEVNDIRSLLAGTDISAVFTTGSTASKLFSRHFGHLNIRHIPLPSTSPANARLSLDDLTEAYRIVAELASEQSGV